MNIFARKRLTVAGILGVLLGLPAFGQQVTYFPYIQLGDNGPFGATDQIVIAWQTNEPAPKASAYQVEYGKMASYGSLASPAARVVDNYVAADASLPVSPNSYGAHSDYTTVLQGLEFNSQYFYKVTGPGLPAGGFASSFHTRKKHSRFSFAVEGDEGFFPLVPASSPVLWAD